jgi:hypothetical protein
MHYVVIWRDSTMGMDKYGMHEIRGTYYPKDEKALMKLIRSLTKYCKDYNYQLYLTVYRRYRFKKRK